ncbi:hypothetical protein R6Q57_021710 [Mikania cordata]
MDLQHQHQDLDHGDDKNNHQNILNTDQPAHLDLDLDLDLDDDHDLDIDYGKHTLNYEAGPLYCTDNNPPDSYAVCETKVADWLDRNTFIERKASVKFACVKTLDPCQTRSSHRRSVTLNQRPKLSIIGFRKKPVQNNDSKSRRADGIENVRLFRNRSEPGRDYCLLITEPVSPKVSCVGRVGSVRVQGRKAGVWRSFKAAFSNLVQANRVAKISA